MHFYFSIILSVALGTHVFEAANGAATFVPTGDLFIEFGPNATEAEIRDEVRYSIDTLGAGGGYVFCPAHNVQPDVTPERIDAVYRAALEH